MRLSLPTPGGDRIDWSPSGREPVTPQPGGFESRVAYAAAHVVVDPAANGPSGPPTLDWESTLAFRHHLWNLGFGVAEAMDTAQRGSGIGWPAARELIRRSAEEDGGPLVCGAMTDQLPGGGAPALRVIADAYQEQVSFIDEMGGDAIIMASRHLADVAESPEDYVEVYATVISNATRPVMIHWLGPMFDAALTGYWGSTDPREAAETVLAIISLHPEKVSGLKLSMLDADLEVSLRGRLPAGVRMFTGDDLNFVDLMLGDEQGHSDALLGVLDPVAPIAAAALQALDRNDVDGYRATFQPVLPLAHHLFSEPTHHYKTDVVFLAYLNGFQDHFRMVAGAEADRSIPHLARILILADEAGALVDPERAAHRMGTFLALAGV